MFGEPSQHEDKLDSVIGELLDNLSVLGSETEEYSKTADQLVKLQKLKAETRPKPMSKDTLATIVANLLGIGLILGYERANVVTSKALSFVIRTR